MRVSPIGKRDTFPTTPRTTHFSVQQRGRIEVSLGGTQLGNVTKRDGFFVATYLWGEEIAPKAEHTLFKKNKKGEVIEKTDVPVGGYLKTVRDALIQRFFPNVSAANASQMGG